MFSLQFPRRASASWIVTWLKEKGEKTRLCCKRRVEMDPAWFNCICSTPRTSHWAMRKLLVRSVLLDTLLGVVLVVLVVAAPRYFGFETVLWYWVPWRLAAELAMVPFEEGYLLSFLLWLSPWSPLQSLWCCDWPKALLRHLHCQMSA